MTSLCVFACMNATDVGSNGQINKKHLRASLTCPRDQLHSYMYNQSYFIQYVELVWEMDGALQFSI